LNEWNHPDALLRAAQKTFDDWRHDPRRGPLDRAIDRVLESPDYADTIVTSADRVAFRKVIFAIKANKGHGYTNPARLLDIVDEYLDPANQARIAVPHLADTNP